MGRVWRWSLLRCACRRFVSPGGPLCPVALPHGSPKLSAITSRLSIIGDDTCLCNTGFEFDTDNSTCVVKDYGTTPCAASTSTLHDQVNDSYQCLVHTECSGTWWPSLPIRRTECALLFRRCVLGLWTAMEFRDARANVHYIQFVRGSLPSGDPDCVNLSPPCPSYTYGGFRPRPPRPGLQTVHGVSHRGGRGACCAPSAMCTMLAIFVLKR